MPPTELPEKPEEIPLKCVIIVEAEIPLGTASNAIAILGVSLGSRLPNIVGPVVIDGSTQVTTRTSLAFSRLQICLECLVGILPELLLGEKASSGKRCGEVFQDLA